MFVIADMEWMTNTDGHHSPTQLAAVRVAENWKVVEEFNAFIRPRDSEFHDWKHVSYTGGTATEFIHARNAHNVLNDFQEWLNEDDVLLWWYDESDKLFKKLVSLILKLKEPHKSVSFGEYVYAFLSGQPHSKGNPYKLAEGRGIITIPRLKHNAKNDVRVMRELMAKISFPQGDLLKPLVKPEKVMKPHVQFSNLPFQYDPQTNTIHIKECPYIADINTQGYETLKNPIRKGYKPCDCCMEEYKAAFRERNMDILERTQYTYIYSPESSVFHKYTCGVMLSAKSIMGTRKYETVVNTGRTPCRLCNPTAFDVYKPLPPQLKIKKLTRKVKNTLGKEDSKAIGRHKVASEERYRRLKDETLTEIERNDVFTLTQPRFAFFVGKGYQTFHLPSCSKLQEVSNLRGFSTYKDAIRAGFTPCRKCKPTAKHDAKLSIPITNRIRENEKVEDLEALCNDAGYPCRRESEFLYLETPAGKWRINTNTSPVKLEHINLIKTPGVKTYHEQPRVFLSYVDTFDYIKRHDEELMRKAEEGLVFLKFVSND